MSVTHPTAVRNAATDAVTALIGASGKLKFRLTGTVGSPGTAVATLSLSATHSQHQAVERLQQTRLPVIPTRRVTLLLLLQLH